MDKKQMEMLSVKSAMERVIEGYIQAYQKFGTREEFFDAVNRMVAALYASGQIDRNYRVFCGTDVRIEYTTQKQKMCLTYMLPPCQRWNEQELQKVEKFVEEFNLFDVSLMDTEEQHETSQAYENLWGKKSNTVKASLSGENSEPTVGSEPTPTKSKTPKFNFIRKEAEKAVEEDPELAYERAKQYVERM